METQSRIQQRHTMPNSNRSIGFTLVLAVVTLALAACIPCSAAFNLQMEYKPPVKSSVGKLHDRRFSRDSSNPAKADSPSRSSSSKSAYAAGATYYQPEAPPAGVDSFERRMRDMVLGNQQQKRETTTTRKPPSRRLPPNVQVVESLQQYKTVVADEKERVVAVRFYAPWCKACKAVAPLYYHLATKYPDVVFVDVPVTNHNANLHQGLGVPSLPFGHIYDPVAGLVEELKLTRKHLSVFEQSLHSYYTGSCDLNEEA